MRRGVIALLFLPISRKNAITFIKMGMERRSNAFRMSNMASSRRRVNLQIVGIPTTRNTIALTRKITASKCFLKRFLKLSTFFDSFMLELSFEAF